MIRGFFLHSGGGALVVRMPRTGIRSLRQLLPSLLVPVLLRKRKEEVLELVIA